LASDKLWAYKVLKFIWTTHLFKNNKGCALVGTQTSNDNNKSNNTTTINSNVCIPCLPTTIIVVVLRSSAHHIGGWNCTKFMHKFQINFNLSFMNDKDLVNHALSGLSIVS
jgi:hypothetical protein